MAADIFKKRCPLDCVKYLGFAGIRINYELCESRVKTLNL
jgi:hypothetical protein